jgi:formylglycine-generating enzyme required for sulfatase activity
MRVVLLLLLIAGALAASAPARAGEPLDRDFRECSVCPLMVAIPAGRFLMGSPKDERGRFDSEGPQHWVSVRAFALGKYPVTNGEFLAFLRETGYQPPPCDRMLGLTWRSPGRGLAYTPGQADPLQDPAVCLNWNDAQAYLAWLNRKVRGSPYRLPSEAEWEYAARGGTRTARWWGDAIGVAHANCNGCGSRWDNRLLAPVGSFGANAFGLDDMLGNAWEWVADCWHDSYVGAPENGSAWTAGDCRKRVMRGGSWSNVPEFIRSAARNGAAADGADFDSSSYVGFRVARRLP